MAVTCAHAPRPCAVQGPLPTSSHLHDAVYALCFCVERWEEEHFLKELHIQWGQTRV